MGSSWLQESGSNLRLAVRMLRQSPGFAATAVLTLALCIGANTAIITVVDSVVLRPLPFPHPERLAEVAVMLSAGSSYDIEPLQSSGLAYQVVRAHSATLRCAAISESSTGVNLVVGGVPEFVQRQRISAGLFAVLGVRPFQGRELSFDEEQGDGSSAVILSYGLWQRAFNANPAVLGQSILLSGEPHTVVGIMPPGLQSWLPADLWTPLRPDREEGNYRLVARLRSGVDWQRANAEMQSLAGPALADLPRSGGTMGLRLIPLQEGLTQGLRFPVLVVWAAGTAVLLIGCLNLAGLLLARASRRRREIATCMALGGGRATIVRQVMTESLLLAALGGTCGIWVGHLSLQYLRQLARDNAFEALARHLVGLDIRTLGLSACLSILTTVVFGLVPAFRLGATDIRLALTASGGHGVAGAAKRWPRHLLIATEIALAVMLLVATGLLVRSIAYQVHLSPGFDPANLVVVRASLADARYGSEQRVNRLFSASLERIRNLPGVESAAVSLGLPYERPMRVVFAELDGPDLRADGNEPHITGLAYITPGYFSTLRIPVLRGRSFEARDRAGSAAVVVVNHTFANRYFPGQAPVGRHIKLVGVRREIVGVVGDVLQRLDLNPYGPLVASPTAFIPTAQVPDALGSLAHLWFSPAWEVRTVGSWNATVTGIEHAMTATDSALPLHGFQTMAEVRSRSVGAQRFQTMLLGTFAGLALLLAAVGLYGAIAQTVVERTRELGIRMALGATVAQAVKAVALPGIGWVLTGTAAGIAAARLALQVLTSMTFGIAAGDPLTYAAVAMLLAFVGICASLIPSLRIVRIDPTASLRSD
jgi:predicted permease